MAARDRNRAPRSGSAAPLSPLVERDVELAALDATLTSAGAGLGRIVLFEAGAGLGKSRLLDEAASRAHERGMLVLRARAVPTERDFAFGLVLRLFEPYLSGMSDAARASLFTGSAALARPLLSGDPPGADHPRARSQFSLFHGLFWLAANIAESAPVLMCVDDLHWCDDGSVRFLLYLARRVEDLPIALLCAARPRRHGESEPLEALRTTPTVTRKALAPLGLTGVRTVMRSLAPAAAHLCAACVDVTEGNPFYLVELLRALDSTRGSPLNADPDRVRELGSASIARASLLRLVQLGPQATALGESLAILGGQAPLHLVAALAGLPPAEAADLADALAADALITSGTELDFVHPLIRQSIYDEMPPTKRAVTHAAAARLLHDGAAPAEVVAAQLLRALPAAEAWAVKTLRAAAHRASSRGEPASAARYLQRALIEGCPAKTREELRLELGTALTAAALPGASDHLRSVLADQTDRQRRVEVERLLARALVGEAQPVAAAEILEHALDSLQPADTMLRTRLLADYLTHAAFDPELRQRAIDRLEPTFSAPRDATTPEARLLLAALAMRAGQSWQPNPETIALAERAWSAGKLLLDEGPDGAGWLMTVWAAELADDHRLSSAVCTAALAAARASGSVHAFAAASYFHGYACLATGRLVDAQADAEQAIDAGNREWHPYLVPSLVLRANALIQRAQLGDAQDTLTRAAAIGGKGMLEVPWTAHANGRLALAQHRPADALALFQQAGAYLTDTLRVEHTVLPWRTDAARAAILVGNHPLARELIDAELTAAERKQAPVARGRALGLLGLITEGQAGLALLVDAADLLRSTDAELEHAQALTDLGAALRRSGRRADAHEPLSTALAITQRLEAEPLAMQINVELAAAGYRPSLRRQRDAVLTPSESRVADLASQGLTNKEISQALFITPKTVEYHLGHVYQSLNIPGRRNLKAALGATVPQT